MKAYISGRISGTDDYEQRFGDADLLLQERGFETWNPVVGCWHLRPGSEWHEYMRLCVAALAKCDLVVMLPGWQLSRGATEEHRIAAVLRIPIRDLADFS